MLPNRYTTLGKLTHLAVAWSLACGVASPESLGQRLCAQDNAAPIVSRDLPPGFSRVSGKHIELMTDLPLDDDLRELPAVFDAAIARWCEVFEIPLVNVESWRVEAYVMRDRQRFINAGFLPKNISQFINGYQLADRLWVNEQPSAYYRRHLLLHEGTHWIMSRKFGGLGPPWLAEGMAEWLGTHRWDGQHLEMGVIPTNSDEVPYWGRTKTIQEQLGQGEAPSLETILRYSNTAHQQQEAYVWSWAAVVFLKNHPDTAAVFAQLLQQSWHGSDDANRWLFTQLRSSWPRIRQQWQATLSDLDYGFDPQHGLLTLSTQLRPLRTPQKVIVQATEGWQASGFAVAAGTRLTIKSTGEFSVGSEPKPWKCTAAGVQLEYYHGIPLGRLLMSTASTLQHEPDFAQPLKIQPVGDGGQFTITQGGELL
ncbi:MAG: hypothetical protein ABI557_04580, partial [Aureliella sp.]